MQTRNALATARLSYEQPTPAAPYRVSIEVWNHSYDHPDPARRNALVDAVFLTQLPSSKGYAMSDMRVKDRYGVDHTHFWLRTTGAQEEGFVGYAEYDTAGVCGPGLPNVFWGAFSGVYDERCIADAACDAMRLQSYVTPPAQVAVFNYLVGPVTFTFDIRLKTPPTAVRLRLGHIGGNGGDPAQRSATLPSEEFVIQFG